MFKRIKALLKPSWLRWKYRSLVWSYYYIDERGQVVYLPDCGVEVVLETDAGWNLLSILGCVIDRTNSRHFLGCPPDTFMATQISFDNSNNQGQVVRVHFSFLKYLNCGAEVKILDLEGKEVSTYRVYPSCDFNKLLPGKYKYIGKPQGHYVRDDDGEERKSDQSQY